MKELISSSGRRSKVDDHNYERCIKYIWTSIVNKSGTCYWFTCMRVDGVLSTVYLARFILNMQDKNLEVDHMDWDTENNQEYNLRPCTHAQNSRNKKPSNISKYGRGVTISSCSTYTTRITVNGIIITLGTYKELPDAVSIYEYFSRILHLDFGIIYSGGVNEKKELKNIKVILLKGHPVRCQLRDRKIINNIFIATGIKIPDFNDYNKAMNRYIANKRGGEGA